MGRRLRRGGSPPRAPSGKTGWEALDKWVGGSGGAAAPAARTLRQDRLGGARQVGRRLRWGGPRRRRCGPSGKTGWEALDKWVGGGGGGSAAPAAGPSGTTGWEALDKWVGDGGGSAPSAQASAGNGAAAASEAAAPAAAAEPAASGGFVGFLKRLFGGK